MLSCILGLHSDLDQSGIFACFALAQVIFSCSFSNKVGCIKQTECHIAVVLNLQPTDLCYLVCGVSHGSRNLATGEH